MATGVTAVLALAGLLATAKAGCRPVKRAAGSYAATLPAVTGCVWLMDAYRGHAADPVLWDYVPLLLAIAAGMLFYVELAGLSATTASPRRLLWTAGMTAVLSITALADGESRGDALLLLSQAVAALAVLWRLPPHLEEPPAPEPEGAQPTMEETTHE
jgi:hypothetical protein